MKATIIIALISIFVLYVNEVFMKFLNGYTNSKILSDIPKYLDSPTFVLCMGPEKKQSKLLQHNLTSENLWTCQKNCNISMRKILNDISYIIEKDFSITLLNAFKSSQKDLKLGNNKFKDGDKKYNIEVTEILNNRHSICYKITPKFKIKDESFFIYLQFNSSNVSKKDMPKAVNVYITSEMNSYGIHSSRWKEGEELVGMVTNKKSLETINGHRGILSKMQFQTQFLFKNLTKNS